MYSLNSISSLGLILTAQCNLRCSYCYQNAKKSQSMRWKTLAGALDLILESQHRDLKVNFTGGEPLLEFPKIRRAVRYIEEKRPPGKRIQYSTSTNATLLTRDVASFLAQYSLDTQISFDGIADAQNHRGAGTFEIIDKALDHLRREHPGFYHSSVSIALTLTSSNIQYLADSVAYLIRKGVKEITISPVITADCGWRNDLINELDAQFARIYESSLEQHRNTGDIPLDVFQNNYDRVRRIFKKSEMCGVVSNDSLVVDVGGQAYGCTVLASSYQRIRSQFLRSCLNQLQMGNIEDPGFSKRYALFRKAVRKARLFNEKEDKYSSYGRCGDCPYIAECSVCPVSIGHVPGNSDPNRVPDLACAYNLISRKYRGRFPSRPHPKDLFACPPEVRDEIRRWETFTEALKG